MDEIWHTDNETLTDVRDKAVNNGGIALAKARDAVTAAADALEDAQEDLEDFLDGPEISEFNDSQSRLAVARANLFDTQDDLVSFDKSGPDYGPLPYGLSGKYRHLDDGITLEHSRHGIRSLTTLSQRLIGNHKHSVICPR